MICHEHSTNCKRLPKYCLNSLMILFKVHAFWFILNCGDGTWKIILFYNPNFRLMKLVLPKI